MKVPAHRKPPQGFTLVEIAVVMVIIGLIIVGSLTSVSALQKSQRTKDNTAALNAALEALIGFATTSQPWPRLPCPDNNGDRLEDLWVPAPPANGSCATHEGWLPTATLGLPDTEAWGNRIRYRVDANFSDRPLILPPGGSLLSLSTVANLRVCSDPACGAGTVLGNNLPVVLVSHGANGRGARNSVNGLIAQPAAGTHERANTDGRNAGDTADVVCPLNGVGLPNAACTFISHDPREAAGTGGEFDDAVAWLPAATLFNQLVKAGRLP